MRRTSPHLTRRGRLRAATLPALPAALLVALLPGPCAGQESEPAREAERARESEATRESESAGASGTTAEARYVRDRVSLAAREFLRRSGAPGVVVSWIRGDGEPVTVAAGLARREAEGDRTPMEPGTRFLVGSVGKTFVAATVLSLVRDRRIELDAPVSRWLGDEGWFPRLPNADRITVRMLLSHTSGVPEHLDRPRFVAAARERWAADPDRAFRPEELVGFVLDAEPLFEPGTAFHYADTNYILLGLVVERVTGRDFYAVLGERFLLPLGLEDTAPAVERRFAGLATGYNPRRLFGLPEVTVRDGALVVSPANEWTGGGLVSSAPDLARWMEALATGRTALGAEGFGLMREGAPAASRSYGLGLSLGTTGGGPVWGHDGYFPGYRARIAYFPERRLAVAVLTNTDTADPGTLTGAVAEIVAGAPDSGLPTVTADVGEGPAPRPTAACEAGAAAGSWSGRFTVPRGPVESRLVLKDVGGGLRGTWTAQGAMWAVEGQLDDDRLHLRTTGRPEGPGATEVEDLEGLLLEGRLDDGRLEGVLTPILRGRGPLARPDLRWSVTRDGC